MNIPNVENSLLLVIDMQEKFVPALPEMPQALMRTEVLVKGCAALKMPILVTEQYPQGLGQTVELIRAALPPDTPVFEKTSFSALNCDTVRKAIAETSAKNLILCGVEAHVCLFQTAIQAQERGYEVFLACDAVASRKELDKIASLHELRQLGIHVVPTETILFLLLKDAQHPAFREVSKIVK